MGYHRHLIIEGGEDLQVSDVGGSNSNDLHERIVDEEYTLHVEDIKTLKRERYSVSNLTTPAESILRRDGPSNAYASNVRDEIIYREENHTVFEAVDRSGCTTKKEIIKKSRCVHFGDAIMVFLIPCRREYKAAGLISVLWWVKADFITFREAAISTQVACNPVTSHPMKRQCVHSISDSNEKKEP